MKEHSLIFGGPMVRAILAGKKTQTRRIIKPLPSEDWPPPSLDKLDKRIVQYRIGDRAWVRETWADVNTEAGPALLYRADQHYHWCSEDAWPVEYERYPGCQFTMWCGDLLRGEPGHPWKSPILMPRWASRITLEITDVRVQQLLDISEEDARAEGFENGTLNDGWSEPRPLKGMPGWTIQAGNTLCSAAGMFQIYWQTIHPDWDWDEWVVALTFKRSADREG